MILFRKFTITWSIFRLKLIEYNLNGKIHSVSHSLLRFHSCSCQFIPTTMKNSFTYTVWVGIHVAVGTHIAMSVQLFPTYETQTSRYASSKERKLITLEQSASDPVKAWSRTASLPIVTVNIKSYPEIINVRFAVTWLPNLHFFCYRSND